MEYLKIERPGQAAEIRGPYKSEAYRAAARLAMLKATAAADASESRPAGQKRRKTMFTYRIDNDSRKGELQTVRTRKQLDRAYSAWYTWTDDVRGQAFCSSYFSAWDKEGNCVIADFA